MYIQHQTNGLYRSNKNYSELKQKEYSSVSPCIPSGCDDRNLTIPITDRKTLLHRKSSKDTTLSKTSTQVYKSKQKKRNGTNQINEFFHQYNAYEIATRILANNFESKFKKLVRKDQNLFVSELNRKLALLNNHELDCFLQICFNQLEENINSFGINLLMKTEIKNDLVGYFCEKFANGMDHVRRSHAFNQLMRTHAAASFLRKLYENNIDF